MSKIVPGINTTRFYSDISLTVLSVNMKDHKIIKVIEYQD